jgi:hypothetical protein
MFWLWLWLSSLSLSLSFSLPISINLSIYLASYLLPLSISLLFALDVAQGPERGLLVKELQTTLKFILSFTKKTKLSSS